MEKKPGAPDKTDPPEPPPYDPDPDLITYLERGRKPSEGEIQEGVEKT